MPFRPNGLITLTTDFGTRDGYVGAMKGRALDECPRARIVDLTHDIPPEDVRAGGRALAAAAPWFPAGTVHVATVDPGVGSQRRALLIEAAGSVYLGPDNGLLTRAAPPGASGARVLDRLPADWAVHPTFHGRDLFARVAGRLAAGAAIDDFASQTPVAPMVLVDPAPVLATRPGEREATIAGEVIHVDRFGNLITNVRRADLEALFTDKRGPDGETDFEGRFVVEVGARTIPFARIYAEVAPGAPLAYLGSSGEVELAVRDGSAAELFGVGHGIGVLFRRSPTKALP